MMRDAVMAELHNTHAGMVKIKSVARMHFWWPGISYNIEQGIRRCEKCQAFKNDPGRAPFHPWEAPRTQLLLHISAAQHNLIKF